MTEPSLEIAAPEDGDLDDPEIYPMVPGIDTGISDFRDRFVDYNLRGLLDVVLSGPVIGGWGPGRYFRSRRLARAWCEAKYGAGRVKNVEGFTKGRWAFLIKNMRSA